MKRAAPRALGLTGSGLTGLLGLLLLGGCAAPRDPWGLDVLRGRAAFAANGWTAPDSLQAEIGVQPSESGTLPFTTRLYALPHRAYRLDAFGFATSVLASFRWENGAWLFVRHDAQRYWQGEGKNFEVEGAPLRLPDVHAVLGFAWGELLPGFKGAEPAVGGVVRWTHDGEPWEAVFDSATGVCREVRSRSLAIRYAVHRVREGRALPELAEIFVDGKPAATLRVREVVRHPSWRKSPFALPIPPSYSPGNR